MKKSIAVRVALLLAGLPVAAAALHAKAGPHPPTVHVFVALADNRNQGIVPVPAHLGNGQDPATNLYWGAAFGVKTVFKKSPGWKPLSCAPGPRPAILERCIFRRGVPEGYLVADAYDGARIREAIDDFLAAAAGRNDTNGDTASETDLAVYVGHDGLMDFQVPPVAGAKNGRKREFIILACASKAFFEPYMKQTGSEPLLWTTGLMAPEAYTLEAALEGWFGRETPESIRIRAATAYNRYQKCGVRAAQNLFASSW